MILIHCINKDTSGEYVVFVETEWDDLDTSEYLRPGFTVHGTYELEVSHLTGQKMFLPGEGDCYVMDH